MNLYGAHLILFASFSLEAPGRYCAATHAASINRRGDDHAFSLHISGLELCLGPCAAAHPVPTILDRQHQACGGPRASERNALALPASYVNGMVTVNPLPSLSIARSGTNVALGWPLWATNSNVQQCLHSRAVQGCLSNFKASIVQIARTETGNATTDL